MGVFGGTFGDILETVTGGASDQIGLTGDGGSSEAGAITHQLSTTASTLVTNETPSENIAEDFGRWLDPRQGTDIGLPIVYGTRRT